MRSTLLFTLGLTFLCVGCAASDGPTKGVERFAQLSSYVVTSNATMRKLEDNCVNQQGIRLAPSLPKRETSIDFGTDTVSRYFLTQPDSVLLSFRANQAIGFMMNQQEEAARLGPISMDGKRYPNGCASYSKQVFERSNLSYPKLATAYSSINKATEKEAKSIDAINLNQEWKDCLDPPTKAFITTKGIKDPGGFRMTELIEATATVQNPDLSIRQIRDLLAILDTTFSDILMNSSKCGRLVEYQERFDKIRNETLKSAIPDQISKLLIQAVK
jgi:hypothetical protein